MEINSNTNINTNNNICIYNNININNSSNIKLSNKTLTICNYNDNNKKIIINYDIYDNLYVKDLKKILEEEHNINSKEYIFLNNFSKLKRTSLLNNTKNIIIIKKSYYNLKFKNKTKKNNNNDNESDSDIDIDINDDYENTNINTTKQKDNEDKILLHKYFRLFDKYPDLIIFVYILNYDLNNNSIISILESLNKTIFNIIKNNQKEIIHMCSSYPDILKLYYKDLLSTSNRSVYDIITLLRNNTNTTSNTVSNPNSLLINDIQNMFPNTQEEDIEDLINVFIDGTLII